MSAVPANGNGYAKSSLMATWAGVILTLTFGIGGAIGVAFGLALEDTRASVDGLQERELVNARESGRLEERIGNHGTALVKLDEVLQREMRLLDEAMEAKLIDLDARLQGEIARASAVGQEDRQNLRDAINAIRAYQDSTRERNAQQDEAIRHLERKAP